MDSEAIISLCTRDWLKQYLANFEFEMEKMTSTDYYQVFKLGPSKSYRSKIIVEILLVFQRLDDKDDILEVQTYIVDADVRFLCGMKTPELWQ